MSNYTSNFITNNNDKNNCLEQYYRCIVGMSMNQQTHQQQQLVNAIINQNDINQYQKIYVDTLVGKQHNSNFIVN
jgi:hypothetical protein